MTSKQAARAPLSANKRRPISVSWQISAPDEALRKTGIPPLGCIPWGSHICLFYETVQDLIEAAMPYFHNGIAQNECCIWTVTPPLTPLDAWKALGGAFPNLDELREKGAIDVVVGMEWYLNHDQLNPQRISDLWIERIDAALARGFSGVRASANSMWQRLDLWKDFQHYERMVEQEMAGRRMILLCTYCIEKSRAEDVLDVACNHQCIIARRNHAWKFLEAPGNDNAQRELECLNSDWELLVARPDIEKTLTQREKIILGQLVKGQSSKQIARTLGISHRTVDFHRANLLNKFNAKNTAELVRRVLQPD